jgi:hypothetical protein
MFLLYFDTAVLTAELATVVASESGAPEEKAVATGLLSTLLL